MITFTSPAFGNGDTIPVKYTQDGDNVSPPFKWSGLAANVQEMALICEDPDTSRGPGGDDPFVHWMVYALDPATGGLPEGLDSLPELYKPLRARQGRNSYSRIGYVGPLPPMSDDWHRYRFQIYALNHHIDLKAGANRDDFLAAIDGHVLASAEIVAKFHRTERLHENFLYKRSTSGPPPVRPELRGR